MISQIKHIAADCNDCANNTNNEKLSHFHLTLFVQRIKLLKHNSKNRTYKIYNGMNR